MYHPTTRVLTILELLQSYGQVTGRELARRLEVDPRTIRRYITMLQDMGIPIEAERGRDGAYFLRRGYKLPPLMFSQEEAFAVALSLQVAKQTALYGSGIVIEGAAAKIERVLPETIRHQVQAILDILSIELNLVPTVETAAHIIQAITSAVYQHRQVRLTHSAFDGTVTERHIDPYGVAYRVGRWYVVGFCHLREDIRTFRLDRIQTIQVLETSFEPQPINVIHYVEQALARTPGLYQVEVIFTSPANTVRRYIPSSLGQLVELDEQHVHLTCFVQSLEWIAGFLAGIPLPQRILRPEALRQEMASLAKRVLANLD